MEPPTMAAKLGTTAHMSPLLRKARKLGLEADGLERLAIERGCDYYDCGHPPLSPPVSTQAFSNQELAIALLNPALRYSPQSVRLGAAILSSEGNRPDDIARMAKMERCESLVRYVAEAGDHYEPENGYWRSLLSLLPQTSPPKAGVVPHPSRFVAMTGMTRKSLVGVSQWIRPKADRDENG